MAYQAPNFTNDSIPALNAANMNALAEAVAAAVVANGGTGRKTFTEGAILLGNGTDPIDELTGTGALFANANGDPEFGTLPVSCGGTGVSSLNALKDAIGLTNAGFVVSAEEPTDISKLWINTSDSTISYYYSGTWVKIRGVFGS